MNRVTSIDFVRGLVMIIMALDHVRDFIHISTQNPNDLNTTTPALFMTRWITHFCAPIFVFLSGTSAYLSLKNHHNFAESRSFQLKRGLWLILLNFTLVNFGIFIDPHFSILFLQVIATIGFGFVCLSFLMKFPARTLGIVGLIIIFLHNFSALASFKEGSIAKVIWAVFFGAGFFPITPSFSLLTTYALIPWLGIMLCGYAFGSFFNRSDSDRQKLFLKLGLASLALFILLRTFNIYGDPSHWSFQKNGVFSILSFINVSKYPPSLLFSLITLGVLFLLLSLVEKIKNTFTDIVSVYGKVPLFYYIIHWFVIHFISIGVFLFQGFHWSDLQFSGFGFGRPKEGGGLDLMGTYLVWLIIVVSLYPACKWFWQYKLNNKDKTWLRYL